MKVQNQNSITTRVAGTNNHTFNVPDIGDRVVLLHNPYNTNDANSIIVVNSQLQQIGHLTKTAGFNQTIGKLIDWKPYIAEVIAIYPLFAEIFIKINNPIITIEVANF